jgi:hypothetical protein
LSTIFLSYRRDDSAGFAGRLSDELEARLGAGSVFRDVDDIRPGQDFVAAINSQLDEVNAVLVMIGPHWLAADASGQRRLDKPDDFVRLEIQAALSSGKPLIPLLVGGAAMPTEAILPADIAGLARRQAVVLSDVDWKIDVARLVGSLNPKLAGSARAGRPSRRLLIGLGAAALVLALAVALVRMWMPPPTPQTAVSAPVSSGTLAAPASPAPAASAFPTPAPRAKSVAPAPVVEIAGRWGAHVKYDWGDAYNEVFDFKLRNGQVRGTAGFLEYPRIIEEGRLQGRWLSFVTHTSETLGDQPAKEATNRYEGEVVREGNTDRIHFTLETTGGYSSHVPVEFVAQRVAK